MVLSNLVHSHDRVVVKLCVGARLAEKPGLLDVTGEIARATP